jgi:RimJ/RimL family protein N-acetyltransferase
MSIEVREATSNELPLIVQYWSTRTDEQLLKMGVDLEKIKQVDLEFFISQSFQLPYEQKTSYFVVCFFDGKAVGHSNVGKIIFGEEAYMHLHIWESTHQQQGIGQQMVIQAISWYFEKLQLKKLICEPNAFNEAPNKTLQKVGFSFQYQHDCIPGFINFFQSINRYELTFDQFQLLNTKEDC